VPGKYRFLAKAEDVYGNTVALTPLAINIRPAWWQRLWVQLLGVLMVLILIGVLILQRDRRRSRQLHRDKQLNQKMANLELSALRAQMNPHFVFNALGAIQYFIQLNEVEAADTYLTRFAKLMRSYLDSSRERLIPLSKEIELLQLYTQLEELRFEGQFTTELIIANGADIEAHYIPSMLLQPMVENAIIHGLNERRDGLGKLIIRLEESKGGLKCEIIDNGIGRKQAAMRKRHGHRSKGMKLIEERIATLRASGIAAIRIDISDAFPADTEFPGTRVFMEIQVMEDDEN
jgi:LytS/YehU family sensor histidine kinase